MTTLRMRMVWVLALLVTLVCGPAQAGELKVLSFNILGGGGQAEANAIAASGADIIGIQEGFGSTETIAGLLEMHYAVLHNSQRGSSNGIISRFPITQVFNNGVKVDMGDDGEAYIFSVHLQSSPYQPYQLHPNAPGGWGARIVTGSYAGDVQAAVNIAEASRGDEIAAVLSEIAANVPDGARVFLVGDFNEPSHQDWTEAAGPDGAGLHSHVVPWPASIKVVDAGFTDSYRAHYPNEVNDPGYTWTTLNSNPEVHDRIDFVYYRGDGLTLLDVQLVGDFGSAGGQFSDIAVGDYPSDHRAVLATFMIPEPATVMLFALAMPLVLRRSRSSSTKEICHDA